MPQSAIVAIRLKVPDNTAYTALVALRRLGVEVVRVERAELWFLDDAGDPATLGDRVRANEAIFNSHVHELEIRDERRPRSGEVWIREIASCAQDDRGSTDAQGSNGRIADVTGAKRAVSWRLFDRLDRPVAKAILACACDALLCNAAIEEATLS